MADAAPLRDRYWYLEGTRATRVDVEPGAFWNQLMTGELLDDIVRRVAGADGWLVTVYDMDADMATEEMHPNGDELHFLLRGRFDLVLAPENEPGGVATVVAMRAGDCAAVPRGVWHRFVVHEPSSGVALTAGRGTEHRPISRGGIP
jgi:mannose-6-phosphate isomerase-like protein (cupin superfamily)